MRFTVDVQELGGMCMLSASPQLFFLFASPATLRALSHLIRRTSISRSTAVAAVVAVAANKRRQSRVNLFTRSVFSRLFSSVKIFASWTNSEL